MTNLALFSEPFAPSGNIAAEGFKKLLGRPAIGLLPMVIREAVQNSMDASLEGMGPEILLRTRVLSETEYSTLLSKVFQDRPNEPETANLLRTNLDDGPVRVFEICDFHTTGLAGPTRADAPTDGPEDLDFVNFMRNVGAARDTHQGGGTYGYGKTSLYALSACSTILVDSQTTCDGSPVRRVMACHLGAAFNGDTEKGKRRFTGRHWWGVHDGAQGVDPVEGPDADELAADLGLPQRNSFRTGTTIMILAPHFGESTDVAGDLLESVLWNFWPRMTQDTARDRKLTVNLTVDGETVRVPPPEEFPPLDLFADALKKARSGEGVKEIKSQRPARFLGNLSIRKGLKADRHPVALRSGTSMPQQASHIALMRPVELVVKYLEGDPYPDKRFEWAGVFICSDEDEVERAFAEAEPPAHDDWIPDMLPSGYGKRYVNVALKHLKEAAKTHANPIVNGARREDRGPSLAKTAGLMGRLLDKSSSQGPGRSTSSRTAGGTRKKRAISSPRFVGLQLDEHLGKVAVFEADLTNDGGAPDLVVVAEPHLVMDGGATDIAGVPVDFKGNISLLALGNNEVEGGRLHVGTEDGKIVCAIQMPNEAAVGVRFQLEEMGGAS